MLVFVLRQRNFLGVFVLFSLLLRDVLLCFYKGRCHESSYLVRLLMRLIVTCKSISVGKLAETYVALEMAPLVHLEGARTHEGAFTDVASIRADVGMLSPVIRQMALRCERSIASLELAAEWLLTCVNSHVRLEVAIFGETLPAVFALEGLLACMCALVYF